MHISTKRLIFACDQWEKAIKWMLLHDHTYSCCMGKLQTVGLNSMCIGSVDEQSLLDNFEMLEVVWYFMFSLVI